MTSRGVVGFAHAYKTKKVGSQFYITYGAQPHLDSEYTVIGRLIDGQAVLDKMEAVPSPESSKWVPETPIEIRGMTVHANPIAEREFEKGGEEG